MKENIMLIEAVTCEEVKAKMQVQRSVLRGNIVDDSGVQLLSFCFEKMWGSTVFQPKIQREIAWI